MEKVSRHRVVIWGSGQQDSNSNSKRRNYITPNQAAVVLLSLSPFGTACPPPPKLYHPKRQITLIAYPPSEETVVKKKKTNHARIQTPKHAHRLHVDQQAKIFGFREKQPALHPLHAPLVAPVIEVPTFRILLKCWGLGL